MKKQGLKITVIDTINEFLGSQFKHTSQEYNGKISSDSDNANHNISKCLMKN